MGTWMHCRVQYCIYTPTRPLFIPFLVAHIRLGGIIMATMMAIGKYLWQHLLSLLIFLSLWFDPSSLKIADWTFIRICGCEYNQNQINRSSQESNNSKHNNIYHLYTTVQAFECLESLVLEK